MTASARIEELRKKFEENPRRYFAPLANEYRKSGDIEQAISICREYLPQQPGHMSGHIVYGQALYEARQFEESKAVFETALTLDPENLIALRHLGDIALIVGDNEVARSWYRRVLEADPRNEEIQAQLARIDQGGAMPTPVGVPSPAPTAEVPPATPKPTPSSAPTVVQEAIKIPPKPQERVEIAAVSPLAAAPAAPVTATSPTDEVPRLELDSAVPGTVRGDAPPIEGFSLDGLETTSLASSPPAAAPQTLSTSPTLELDKPVADAVPSPPPAAPAPPLMDLELSMPADGPTAPPGTAPVSAPSNDLPLLDLNAPAEAPAPPPESGPFVTETMAELYLQQGHRDEALKVYRALLDQRPGDSSLQAKIAAITAPLTPSPAPLAPPTPPTVTAPAQASVASHAPTIREILSLVATRRPGYHPESAQNGGTSASVAGVGTSTPLAGDTLGSLFATGRVSDADEIAARTLALAFAPNGAQTASHDAMPGAPARVASTELSLDSVFSGGAATAAPSNFSFDQFFSKNAAAEGHAAAQSGAESPDDVAKFTEWLQGLKQR